MRLKPRRRAWFPNVPLDSSARLRNKSYHVVVRVCGANTLRVTPAPMSCRRGKYSHQRQNMLCTLRTADHTHAETGKAAFLRPGHVCIPDCRPRLSRWVSSYRSSICLVLCLRNLFVQVPTSSC